MHTLDSGKCREEMFTRRNKTGNRLAFKEGDFVFNPEITGCILLLVLLLPHTRIH